MATKVKPSRIQISGTPQAGDVPVYVDQDNFQWGPNGVGDVVGPSSSVDGDVVLFDGVTGKLIKDSGKALLQSDWSQGDNTAIDYIKNKPTIGDATLTIQKNGTNVTTFTANATSNVTANISVPTKTSDIVNDSGYITKSVNNLDNYTLTASLSSVATSGSYNDLIGTPDLSVYQTVANMKTDLTNPDNNHYPTTKAVSDAITASGGGDMLKATYDPNSVNANAFDYNNFINTPSLAAVATSGSYSDLSNTPSLATVATSGSYNDLSNKPTIPTVNDATLTIQKNGTTVKTFTANASSNVTANISVPTKTSDISNDSGYITKSVNDLTNYTLSSALATVATTGSYSDLSNKPTIPTDTSDLTNGAGFITGITSGDVTTALGYTPQAALSTQTAYTSKGTSTKVPTITTNTLGQVTGITETSIAFPVTSVNGSTGAVTVQPTLVSGTNIKTVNGNSILGSGDITISGGLQEAPNSPITGIKYVWRGSEAQYAALSQYYTDTPGDTKFETY